jgi:hypothetical protein
MVLDYKGTKFSFQKKKQLKRRRQITLAGGVILLVLVFLWILLFIDGRRLESIQDQLLQGNVQDTSTPMENASGGLFHQDAKTELSALIYLFEDKTEEGAATLKNLEGNRSGLRYNEFLAYLAETARYRALEIYSDFLLKNKNHEGVQYFKALARTAFMDSGESRRLLENLPVQEKGKKEKALNLLDETNRRLDSGRIDYIFGANGMPLAYYDLKRKRTVALAPGFDFSLFNDFFTQGIRYFKLTLDLKLQKQIHRMFSKYRGTFVVLRLKDNGITAAYSRPAEKKVRNAALEEQFEAGSIIKVLTLFGYLNKRLPDVFPFQCDGNMTIDGELFYDWLAHGRVETYERALAVSCNLAFGQMGINMGKAYLNQCFDDFFFNRESFEDLFFKFPTGSYDSAASSNLRLAHLAVGLDEVKTTTLHSALMAAMIAQAGSIPQPHIIDNVKNVLNLGFYRHESRTFEVHKDSPAYYRTKQAMVEVQEDELGTGRRSRVDDMLVALKTGTAGSKRKGLDSILMGFFPAEKPRYAFAFRLQGAGKAQLEGAYFLKRFLQGTHLIQNE